ncbi:DHH family phosphoesterase [Psychromonas sp. MME2]|uniref:DHHA1 domain-containing protein n=1 Tax=unclassified Psychromonas TaxID=2614957 RepID=UPI00339BAA67
MNYDIFNGDADGIIALLQWRLAFPLQSQLITGVKRDIQLVEKITPAKGDSLTVLDISMEKNSTAIKDALAVGAAVFYADHHRAGDIPEHPKLQAHIDLDANTCTSLIIDKLLDGQFHDWAIAAAYGDNLIVKADQLAELAGLSREQAEQLKELGTLINYNGYGASVDDLHYHPAQLFKMLRNYPSPFDLLADSESPFYVLQKGYNADMAKALAITNSYQSEKLAIVELPVKAWARRISGVYGNLLANNDPDRAHAVLTENSDGSYLLSLRAPLSKKQGAGEICSQFATGGGRAAAAGINALDKKELQRFIDVVENTY